MKLIKIILILTLTLVSRIPAESKVINQDEAQIEAAKFFGISELIGKKLTPLKYIPQKTSIVTRGDANAPFYIFNSPDNKGFVIISGYSGAKKILAYSFSNHFDLENLPPQVDDILNQYIQSLSNIENVEKVDPSWNDSSTRAGGEVVLSTANWNQGNPYNYYCPEIDGYKCPTGCVATAMAIIMRYHQWPLQGEGSNSYEWNGQILSKNFEESFYEWEKMPTRDIGDEQLGEEQKAIASLMYDCGIALNMNYSLWGSGASEFKDAIVEYFSYKCGVTISREYCDGESFFNIVKSDIDQGLPLGVTSAHLPSGVGAHEFVCDGYNEDGYLHFNFGWGGISNGFYTIDVNESTMGMDLYISQGIRPDKEDDTYIQPDLASYVQYYYLGDEKFMICLYLLEEDQERNFELGLQLENILTGVSKEYPMETIVENVEVGPFTYTANTFTFDGSVDDGIYKVYPIIKFGEKKWKKFNCNEYVRKYIDLLVADGVKNFSNPTDLMPLDEGKVEIDGVYYVLNSENNTATVTYRNQGKDSYRGSVMIPSSIFYHGKEYEVTTIGDRAFENCYELYSVTIPSTIHTIEGGAFSNSYLEQINIEEAYQVTHFDGWTFNGCNLEYIQLPENLVFMSTYDLFLWNLKYIEIPKSVLSMGECFATYPKNGMKVNWTDESDISNIYYIYTDTDWLGSNHNLYVPVGTKAIYQKYSPWSNLNIIESEPDPVILTVINEDEDKGSVEIISANNKTRGGETPMGTKIGILISPKDGYELTSLVINNKDVTSRIVDNVFYTYSVDDLNIYASFQPLSFHPVESVKLENDFSLPLNFEGYSISATVLPTNATTPQLKWKSMNPEIVTVDSESGVITPVAVGTTAIIASTTDGSNILASVMVSVRTNEIFAEEIILTPESAEIYIGDELQLRANVIPEDADEQTIIWSTSNPGVATVTETGLVRALSIGKTFITAICGEVSANCEITVIEEAGIEGLFDDPSVYVFIYSIDGILIKKNATLQDLKTLNKGIYIIKGAEKTYKISI